MKRKHVNIPIFIPHLGCPNQCVFCNQRTISGVIEFDINEVDRTIKQVLSTVSDDAEVEIAFFGGSFTGIERSLMIHLLEIGYKYIESGDVTSIRCSTRPDYIDEDILSILKKYGVRTIELGLQSASDTVLQLCKRGHSFSDEVKACRMIVDHGFELVGQMMIGLPGAALESEILTAEFISKIGASAARIYPTVVFKDTDLCSMTNFGAYTPLAIDDAIKRSAAVYRKFIDSGVKVIRVGLCDSENLRSDETYFAGPNHSALGEMVENEVYYEIIASKINDLDVKIDKNIKLHIYVAKGCLSKAVGQKKRNKFLLIKTYGFGNVDFSERSDLDEFEALIDLERNK